MLVSNFYVIVNIDASLDLDTCDRNCLRRTICFLSGLETQGKNQGGIGMVLSGIN